MSMCVHSLHILWGLILQLQNFCSFYSQTYKMRSISVVLRNSLLQSEFATLCSSKSWILILLFLCLQSISYIKNNNKYRSWEKLVCVAEVELPMILRKYQSYTMSLNCSDKIFLGQSQVQTGVRNVFTDGRTPTKILWNFISHLMKNNKFCACIFQEWTTVILIPPSWIQG